MSDERTIEYMPVSELMTRLHPQNPKDHNIGAIIESFKVHGYVASGVIDDRTGLFLAGHGRVQALNMMKKQGMNAPDGIRNGGGDWLVPVQVGYSSKNDMQAKAYIIADNRLTTLGGWNEVALAELLQELENSDEIDIAASGYDADDLDELLRDIEGYEDGDWSAEEHWVGLPEYQQGDEVSKLKMIVHFENEDDRQDFAQRLGLKITEKTNNTWWPVKEIKDLESVRFEAGNNG